MCTVSYIPLNKGAILTSNRDEHISREIAIYPDFYVLNGKNLVFPKDAKAGGTWFISNEQGDTGVLLNGAFEKHIPAPGYRKSRGLVLPEIFQWDSPFQALKGYDLSGIENFTIILWEREQLREIKWDGKGLRSRILDPGKAQMWSSVTLYDENMIIERLGWFNDWVQSHEAVTQQDILNFHANTHINNKEYGLRITRDNKISTTSITSLSLDNKKATLYHKDFIQNIESTLEYNLLLIRHITSPTINNSEIVQKN
ncbi:MAG TPA: NRDE family protein [Puia sp.]